MVGVRALFAVMLALAGCKQRPVAPSAPDAPALVATPPRPILDHVPANAPYIFAALEPVPRAYWDKVGATVGADIEGFVDTLLAMPATASEDRLFRAFLGRLTALTVEAQGLAGAPFPGRPLLALGVGMNLDAGRALLSDVVGGLGGVLTACGVAAEAELATFAEMLAQPLPPAYRSAQGAMVNVLSFDEPRIEAYALITTRKPGALLDLLQEHMPDAPLGSLPRDGAFHELASAEAMDGVGPLRAAVKPNLVAATLGGQPAADAVATALAAPRGRSPLFAVTYDYPRLLDLTLADTPLDDGARGAIRRLASLVGLVSMWAAPTDRGVAIDMVMEP